MDFIKPECKLSKMEATLNTTANALHAFHHDGSKKGPMAACRLQTLDIETCKASRLSETRLKHVY